MTTTTKTATTPAAWSATAIYTAGMEVSLDGVVYVANWWTQGNDPASNNGIIGTGEPWTIVPSGSGGTTPPVPPAPTGLAATAETSSSVTLSWSAVTPPANATITGYTVLANGAVVGTTTGTSFTVTGLAAGNGYTFTVEAADATGLSKPSAALVAATHAATVTVPAAPTGLVAATPTSSAVTLSWSAVTPPANATISDYAVFENGAEIGTTTATTYAVSGLTAATAYSFTVEAADSAGLSKPSQAVSVTTAAAPTGGSGGTPSVAAWSATAIYTAGMEASEAGIIYEANWWNQDTDPSANYGPNGSGEPWTKLTAGGAPTSAKPTVPTDLAAIGTSSTSTALTWQPSTVSDGTVTGYAVYENGTQIATTTATEYDVTGLTAGKTYAFTVAAEDAAGSSAQSSAVSVTTAASSGSGAAVLFSPYIDMGLTQDDNLVAISQASGIKHFTLAFVQSSGNGTIGWSGTGTIDQDTLVNGTTIQEQVQDLRAIGGDVTISFGGAAGIDPATVATSAAQLQAEYQSVINRYGVNSLDFDIEGAAETNVPSLHLRDEALVGLKAANPGLQISFTVPVLPNGLDSNGLAIMQAAKTDGLTPNVVNVMAMDYGASVDNGGQMGTDAISAALGTAQQLQFLGLDSKIGVTPMIGVNDVSSEVFTLADAQQLASFAAGNSDIASLGYWSVARDNGNGAGQQYASYDTSGIAQSQYQFAGIFEKA